MKCSKSRSHLTDEDRFLIEKSWNIPDGRRHPSVRAIAKSLGLAETTLRRELKRGCTDGKYCMVLNDKGKRRWQYFLYSAEVAIQDARWQASAKGPRIKLTTSHISTIKVFLKEWPSIPSAYEAMVNDNQNESFPCLRTFQYHAQKGYWSARVNRRDLYNPHGRRPKHAPPRTAGNHNPTHRIDDLPEEVRKYRVKGYAQMDTIHSGARGKDGLLTMILPADDHKAFVRRLKDLRQETVHRALLPPESRPEDCFAWLEDGGPFSDPENVAPDRVFETVPRVARKRDGSAAIIWFLGRDNPYGSPGRVIEVAAGNVRAEESIRRRVYGLATQTRGGRFRFDPKRHVAPDSALPQLLARTMVVDPAPERNWFCLWLGVDDKGDVWVYREWPGDYEIPGQGVPGDWAIVSDRRNGVNDGDRGPAQEKFGFGLDKYKAEWARLEGWSDADAWAFSVARQGAPASPVSPESPVRHFPAAEEIAAWAAANGTREPLRRRVLDARAGSQSKISFGEDKTLLELCIELCPDFQPASGRRIGAGEELINALLDPAPGGRALHVLQSCKNTLFALGRHTGADGQKGADKEPIDCLRYALESGMLDDRPDPALDSPTCGGGRAPAPRPNFIEMDYCD